MQASWTYELIGYLASLLVALSLMMRSVLRLRIINLIGSLCFTLYGLIIQAYPVAAVNGLIVLIDLYYLAEMARSKTYFTIMETAPDSAYLHAFLRFYEQDIRRFVPQFAYQPSERLVVWFILRNLVPVGLFVAERDQPDRLVVHLDYVIPGYRDLQPGNFLYQQQADRFRALGVSRICIQPRSNSQRDYVQRMGFAAVEGAGEPLYCRAVERF